MFLVCDLIDFLPHIGKFPNGLRTRRKRFLLFALLFTRVMLCGIDGNAVHRALHVAVRLVEQGDAETLQLLGHLLAQDGERLARMTRDEDALALREKMSHEVCDGMSLARARRPLHDDGIMPLDLLCDCELLAVRGHRQEDVGVLSAELCEPLLRRARRLLRQRAFFMQTCNRPQRLRHISRIVDILNHAIDEFLQSVHASAHEEDGCIAQKQTIFRLRRQLRPMRQEFSLRGELPHNPLQEVAAFRAVKRMKAVVRKLLLHGCNSVVIHVIHPTQQHCVKLRLCLTITDRNLIPPRVECYTHAFQQDRMQNARMVGGGQDAVSDHQLLRLGLLIQLLGQLIEVDEKLPDFVQMPLLFCPFRTFFQPETIGGDTRGIFIKGLPVLLPQGDFCSFGCACPTRTLGIVRRFLFKAIPTGQEPRAKNLIGRGARTEQRLSYREDAVVILFVLCRIRHCVAVGHMHIFFILRNLCDVFLPRLRVNMKDMCRF